MQGGQNQRHLRSLFHHTCHENLRTSHIEQSQKNHNVERLGGKLDETYCSHCGLQSQTMHSRQNRLLHNLTNRIQPKSIFLLKQITKSANGPECNVSPLKLITQKDPLTFML